MKYETFEHRLEEIKRRYGHHRLDMNISANKINGISFLILKNKEGEITDCIILTSEKKPTSEKTISANEMYPLKPEGKEYVG